MKYLMDGKLVSNSPVLPHSVAFAGEQVEVLERDSKYHVTMRPLCKNMGLDWSSQKKLIERDPVLNSTVVMMPTVAHDGKKREMFCLPLNYLNGWLFKIDVSRYKGEMREKLIRYQKGCRQSGQYWKIGMSVSVLVLILAVFRRKALQKIFVQSRTESIVQFHNPVSAFIKRRVC